MFHPRGPSFWELAQQCLSSTERGFDLLAPKFDYTPFRTPDSVLEGVAKVLGPPQSIDDALDVCCGTGAAIEILRPLCRRRVVGMDFSHGMLDVARQRFPDVPDPLPLARVEFICGNVLEMDFHEEFDLAVTLGSNGHILPRDERRFVERVAAALRPSGRFVLVTHELPPWWSRHYLFSRGFNAAMHVRNLLVRPPFVMFYLTFLLPGACHLLEACGFDVAIHSPYAGRLRPLKVVVGTKRR